IGSATRRCPTDRWAFTWTSPGSWWRMSPEIASTSYSAAACPRWACSTTLRCAPPFSRDPPKRSASAPMDAGCPRSGWPTTPTIRCPPLWCT
ncbi:hypothetical protein KR018_008218, partial [Drosophila ironensis]